MKTKLFLTFSLLLTAVTGAWAEPYYYGYCGGGFCELCVEYSFDKTTKTLTLSGQGEMIKIRDTYHMQPWIDFKDEIEAVVIEYGVTNVSAGAFESCSNLKSVTLAASVGRIDDYAFFLCPRLETVTIVPGDLYVIGKYSFSGCTHLTSFDMPATMAHIGDHAFTDSGLTSIDIPYNMTYIGDWAFSSCSNLETVTVYSPTLSFGELDFMHCDKLTNFYVFSDMVEYYKSVPNLSAYAGFIKPMPHINGACGERVRWFLTGAAPEYTLTICGSGAMADYPDASDQPWHSYAEDIKAVVIGNGVSSIGNHAFNGFSHLTNINITGDVRTIGDGAFTGCTGLTSIRLPGNLTTIGNGAFSGCTGLPLISFPGSLTTIGSSAFSGCTALTSLTIPNSVKTIGESAFSGCTTLTSMDIPAGVTSIGESVFSFCDNLTTITVKSGNTVYDSRNGCQAIIETASNTLIAGCKNTVIPDNVTAIGNRAFHTVGLTSIEIPIGVTSIGEGAFLQCTELAAATVFAPSCTLGAQAFDGCADGLHIYVFSDKIASYKAAENWSAYESKITALIGGNCGPAGYETEVLWFLRGTSPHYTLTISGNGAMEDYANATSQPWYAYREQIKSVVVENGVTSIGNHAFYGCSAMTSIEIPVTMRGIGESALQGCSSLTSVEIPSSVTTLGLGVFSGCTALTTVTLYAPSCSLGDYAFVECPALTNIYVFSSLVSQYKAAEHWSDYASKISGIVGGYCGTKGHETEVIWYLTGTSPNWNLIISGVGAMANYTGTADQPWIGQSSDLKTVVIEDGVTNIGNHAFNSCYLLTSVTVPASVTSIGDYAFYHCYGLETVSFATDAQLTTIGKFAFQNCEALASIDFPASLTTIGEKIFLGCSNLAAITVKAGIAKYDSRDGCNALIETLSNRLVVGCKTTVIPTSVTRINNEAFYQVDLTSMDIPASVTAIGDRAFMNCSGLETVTFAVGSQLTSIGAKAFAHTALTSLDIPGQTSSIDNTAFTDCVDLASITVAEENQTYDARNDCQAIIESASNTLIVGCKNSFVPTSVTSIGHDSFRGCTGLTTLEIPVGLTRIDNYAFNGCTGLTSLTLFTPSCGLGEHVFDGCDHLTSLHVFSSRMEAFKTGEHWSAYADIIKPLPTVTTSYMNAYGQVFEDVEAVPLRSDVTWIGAGTYVVNSNVTFNGTLTIDGDVTLILGDGCTLDFKTPNGGTLAVKNINCNGNLDIFGQSKNSGLLRASATGDNVRTIVINDGHRYTQHSGHVIVRSALHCCIDTYYLTLSGGILDTEGHALDGDVIAQYDIMIVGGTFLAPLHGVTSYAGDITLGYTNLTDRITIKEISLAGPPGELKVLPGQTLFNGSKALKGTISEDDTRSDKTLVPISGVTLENEGSSILATFEGTSVAVSVPVNVNVKSVTYNREFTVGKPATIMLPFSKNVSDITGGTFYTFGGVQKEDDKWVVMMNEVVGTLTLNTPYLLVPDENLTDGKLTIAGGATLNTVGGGNGETAAAGSHWTYKGTYENIRWTTDTESMNYHPERAAEIGRVYGFAGVEKQGIHVGDFVKIASGASLRPLGCYLLWNDTPNAANAPAMNRSGETMEELPQNIVVRLIGAADGGVTTVSEELRAERDEWTPAAAWYDLQGRKLNGKPSKSGLYINHGKKILIK